MKKENALIEVMRWAAIAGNILFMLWVSYNAVDENFSGTVYEKLSYIGLMGLLLANIILVLNGRRKNKNRLT